MNNQERLRPDQEQNEERQSPDFKYAQLDPRPIPEAEEKNEKLLGANTLGIEVTKEDLAEQCGLGNIDPQHLGNNPDKTAIEAVLEYDDSQLPEDVTMVTLRADLDSIGSMALMEIKKGNALEDEPEIDTEGLLERVEQIAEKDKFDNGPWPGEREMPTMDNLWPDGKDAIELSALSAVISDYKVPIEDRVAEMKEWLKEGSELGDHPEYVEQVREERKQMVEALKSGDIEIEEEHGVARVVSEHRAAMDLGYRKAPVVVAMNPEFDRFEDQEPGKKYTIAQYNEGYVDLNAVFDELNELEDGWGGSPTIGGSPQGQPSELDIDQVASVVEKHMRDSEK